MTKFKGTCWSCSLAALLLGSAVDVSAVVVLSTGDPEHNTTEPEGELEGSGWQYLGRWGVFVGTVIGPHHFITARHVGGVIGQSFEYRGENYVTRALYESGPTDLRIWEVCEPMPGPYAPLYETEDEVGKDLVIFGRGLRRGEEISLDSPNGPEHRGWRAGEADFRLRWGLNVVSEVFDAADYYDSAEIGELVFMRMEFNRDGGPNEAHVSSGDSGGAMFIDGEDGWALAGVMSGATIFFNNAEEGDGYLATLFDGGGFYLRTQIGDPVRRPRESNIGCDNLEARDDVEFEWSFVEDEPEDVANSFFGLRISHYKDWIRDVMAGMVEPCFAGPWAVYSTSPDGTYRFDSSQYNDHISRTIRIPTSRATRFVRLKGCESQSIKTMNLEDGFLVITY